MKLLQAPLGPNNTTVTTHTFFYDIVEKDDVITQGTTTAINAKNHKTIYSYDGDLRLKSIKRYDENDNQRVQGGFQALTDLAEMGAGSAITKGTWGGTLPAGMLVFARGCDQFITGMRKAWTGLPQDAATSQIMQNMGMSQEMANTTKDCLSIGGTMGGIAALRNAFGHAGILPQSTTSCSRPINVTNELTPNQTRRLGKKVGPTIDSRTGHEIGRFIVDPKGNVMIEPVGGSTMPSGPRNMSTHTLYPNSSNYQRLDPVGHGPNGVPHAHGHLEGFAYGKKGQGISLDIYGIQHLLVQAKLIGRTCSP